VDQYENATFNCTATGPGDLDIVWYCSDGSNCGMSRTNRNNDGSVTSTLVITRVTSTVTVTCAVIQNLTNTLSSEEPANVEVRLPPIEIVQRSTAQLIVPIPTTTMTQPTDPRTPPSPPGELKQLKFYTFALGQEIANHNSASA
jgi:hypothetical protein